MIKLEVTKDELDRIVGALEIIFDIDSDNNIPAEAAITRALIEKLQQVER